MTPVATCFSTINDKIKQDGRDDAKVDLNDPNEVSYANQQANVSTEKHKECAKAAGTSNREKFSSTLSQILDSAPSQTGKYRT